MDKNAETQVEKVLTNKCICDNIYKNKYVNCWCGDKNGCAFTESRDAENRQNADY